MGRIIEPHLSLVRPLNHVLVREKFRELLEIYDNGRFESIMPLIAREISGQYFVITGNHRGMIYSIINKNPKLYIPTDKDDLIIREDYGDISLEFVVDANFTIMEGFELVPENIKNAEEHDIRSFNDLRNTYKIQSLDDIRKFVDGKIDHKWALTYRGDGY